MERAIARLKQLADDAENLVWPAPGAYTKLIGSNQFGVLPVKTDNDNLSSSTCFSLEFLGQERLERLSARKSEIQGDVEMDMFTKELDSLTTEELVLVVQNLASALENPQISDEINQLDMILRKSQRQLDKYQALRSYQAQHINEGMTRLEAEARISELRLIIYKGQK